MNDIYLIGGLFIAVYLLCLWLESKMPKDTCYCDEAEQGRACKSCQPPHLPRGQ